MLQNEEASVKYCQAELDRLSENLMESISAGTFSVPGGHKLYLDAKEKIEQDYRRVPRKGVKVRIRNNGGILQNKIKGLGDTPENLRTKHQLWVIGECGNSMTDLVFKAHCLLFISEESRSIQYRNELEFFFFFFFEIHKGQF